MKDIILFLHKERKHIGTTVPTLMFIKMLQVIDVVLVTTIAALIIKSLMLARKRDEQMAYQAGYGFLKANIRTFFDRDIDAVIACVGSAPGMFLGNGDITKERDAMRSLLQARVGPHIRVEVEQSQVGGFEIMFYQDKEIGRG